MSSRIIPSKSLTNNSAINGSSINPASPISGEMNSTRVVEEALVYEGGKTSTAEVVVDNAEAKIYANVLKLPGTFSVELEDGSVIYFDGSANKRIKLSDYTIKEVIPAEGVIKAYALFKDNVQVGATINITKDTDLEQALNTEINNRLASESEIRQLLATKEDEANREVRDNFTTFAFVDNTEISYTNTINNNVTLTINPGTLYQGFISLLTFSNMTTGKTITINNQDATRYPTRIVTGSQFSTDNSYITSLDGKKIIFARCDGLCLEILIIEETPAGL